MTATTKITAVLTAEDRTKPGFDSAASGMNKFAGVAKTVGGVLATAFAAVQIVEFGKKSVEAYVESERALRQLNYAVIQISKGTEEQVQAINDLSEAMQKKAGIDADALKIGAAQLSTFGLSSKAVVGLTKSLADLTVNQKGVNATADDYTQSANTIAKALNGQFGVLEKSGIRFTEAQRALIEFGSETEKVAALTEGFNQNLKETTDTIGGSAEGAMARLSRAFGEIQEAVGAALVPVLADLAEAFVPIAENIQAFVEAIPSISEMSEAFDEFLKRLDEQTGLVTVLTDVWNNLVFVYEEALKPALQELWVALEPLKPFLDALVQVFGTALVIAIGAAIMILGTLAAALAGLATLSAKIAKAVTDFIVKPLNEVIDALSDAVLWVEKLIKSFEKLNVVQGIKDLGKKITGKAKGGSVSGSTPYMVGEVGPELFVPASAGKIIPNNALGMAGSTINLNFGGAYFMGKEGVAETLANEIMKALSMRMKIQ